MNENPCRWINSIRHKWRSCGYRTSPPRQSAQAGGLASKAHSPSGESSSRKALQRLRRSVFSHTEPLAFHAPSDRGPQAAAVTRGKPREGGESGAAGRSQGAPSALFLVGTNLASGGPGPVLRKTLQEAGYRLGPV